MSSLEGDQKLFTYAVVGSLIIAINYLVLRSSGRSSIISSSFKEGLEEAESWSHYGPYHTAADSPTSCLLLLQKWNQQDSPTWQMLSVAYVGSLLNTGHYIGHEVIPPCSRWRNSWPNYSTSVQRRTLFIFTFNTGKILSIRSVSNIAPYSSNLVKILSPLVRP